MLKNKNDREWGKVLQRSRFVEYSRLGCISLVTICACEVPAAFSFMTNSRTCSSDMEDCAVMVSGRRMSSRIYRMIFFISWVKSLFLFLLLTRFSLICCKDSDTYFCRMIFSDYLSTLQLLVCCCKHTALLFKNDAFRL